ncbi:MAG: purine-binding chemotaxis protein CheW [Alphaproteobacteria bacterium]|nr:MAG: purine-binding chemotaxis protein CheW [Alphaproteobacteria bacterium]
MALEANPPHSEDGASRQEQGSTQARQYVTFTINSEEYGVDIMDVREIKGWTHATRLPNAPSYVRGVINLRGLMLPIFDLRSRFGQGETDASKTHVIVIVAVGSRTIGILVDAVSDILSITQDQIRPAPEFEQGHEAAYLHGLVSVSERMVALLALDRLFDLAGVREGILDAAVAEAVPQAAAQQAIA